MIDFGASETQNSYEFSDWNTPLLDSYSAYENYGPGGTTIVVGSNYLYNNQGVQGSSAAFQAGQQIFVFWYNNSDSDITMTPKISFDDPDRMTSGTTGTWYEMSSVTVPAYSVAKSIFEFDAATAGSYSLVNVNVQYHNSETIICDKIMFIASADQVDTEAPTVPSGLSATAGSSTKIDLAWSPSSDNFAVLGYWIYRDGVKQGLTLTNHYTDTVLEPETNYTYQISAFDEQYNTSSLSALVIETTPQYDRYWGQWHGPAQGDAYLPNGPGANLEQKWMFDLCDPNGDGDTSDNIGYDLNNVYRSGTLMRSDNESIYIKVNRDYAAANTPTVLKLDPATSTIINSYGPTSGQDQSTSRAFQLYENPNGHMALHAAAFWNVTWDTYDLITDQGFNYFSDSHACMGSRVLMGAWAHRNRGMRADYSISYYHGGKLYYWDRDKYVVYGDEDLQIIDHAWDGTKMVLFALTGFASSTQFEKARYIVLDNFGNTLYDVEMNDIYRPYGSTSWRTYNTDIVMRLCVRNNRIYAIERNVTAQSTLETNLVCRNIDNSFSLVNSISFGSDGGKSYAVNDNGVFVQNSDNITAYSLDLGTELWSQPTSTRSNYHSSIQVFDYARYPGTRNAPKQTMACDDNYLYATTNDRFLVLSTNEFDNGSIEFEHLFTDLPAYRKTTSGSVVAGLAGDVMLMPDYVIVNSTRDGSRLWAFSTAASSLKMSIRLFLQGAYDADSNLMATSQNYQTALAAQLSSPYAEAPKTVSALPANCIDWVWLELRNPADNTVAARYSYFLKNDGWIVDQSGNQVLTLPDIAAGEYNVIVKHRNHKFVKSASPVDLQYNNTVTVDFSNADNAVGNSMIAVDSDPLRYACWSGDVNFDGHITSQDYRFWYNENHAQETGYINSDLNFDAACGIQDYNLWLENSRNGL